MFSNQIAAHMQHFRKIQAKSKNGRKFDTTQPVSRTKKDMVGQRSDAYFFVMFVTCRMLNFFLFPDKAKKSHHLPFLDHYGRNFNITHPSSMWKRVRNEPSDGLARHRSPSSSVQGLRLMVATVNKRQWFWSLTNSFVICLLAFFGLDNARTTIDFEMCWSNWPTKTVVLRYSTVVWTFKQRIVRCRGPSNVKMVTE